MKSSRLFFNIGAWAMTLIGIGHILVMDIFRSIFIQIANREQVLTQMAESDVTIFGDHTNMLAAFNGFSLATAVGAVGFGVINLLFARAAYDAIARSRAILLLNMLVTLALLGVSIRSFWYGGDIAFGIAFVAFALAYVYRETSISDHSEINLSHQYEH
ncbi:hypothetical protein KFU94_64315 [Chloroflexi bacterium TSY]|nr:hypothetical protein [Chloroflexi bacterium TSY]